MEDDFFKDMTPHEIWRRVHENIWPTKKILVMAEHYDHFVHWCNINNINERSKNVKYVDSPHDIYGRRPSDSILVSYNGWIIPEVIRYWRACDGEIVYGNLKR